MAKWVAEPPGRRVRVNQPSTMSTTGATKSTCLKRGSVFVCSCVAAVEPRRRACPHTHAVEQISSSASAAASVCACAEPHFNEASGAVAVDVSSATERRSCGAAQWRSTLTLPGCECMDQRSRRVSAANELSTMSTKCWRRRCRTRVRRRQQ